MSKKNKEILQLLILNPNIGYHIYPGLVECFSYYYTEIIGNEKNKFTGKNSSGDAAIPRVLNRWHEEINNSILVFGYNFQHYCKFIHKRYGIIIAIITH